MSKFKHSLLFLVSITGIISFPAFATCTRTDLTGTWIIYSVRNDSAERCSLIMPSSGNLISSTSSCYIPDFKTTVHPSGNLTIASDCHITGTITFENLKPRSIDAWISKGKDSISGVRWDSAQAYKGNFFLELNNKIVITLPVFSS